MSIVQQMSTIVGNLRALALARWPSSEILDHVSVKLPAPIFDQLSMDIRAELSTTFDPDLKEWGDHFTFQGMRFDRVDGAHWKVSV